MKNVRRSQMPVRLEQHFQRKRNVQEAQAARVVPSLHADELARALFEEGSGRNVFRPARRMIADFLGRVFQ